MDPNYTSRGEGRQPCPDRILDDCGGAFVFGAIGGTGWYALKGFHNSPWGMRIRGASSMVRTRVPKTAGAFAVWGGLFSACDCMISSVRGKEDPLNAILSGAATGGLLAARGGPAMMVKSAVFGGVILTMIEGIAMLINKTSAPATPPMQ